MTSTDVMGVSLSDLSLAYGGALAVKGVNLTIARGELLVLLGPSGCGKTTTMRAIAGLEVPVGGTIVIGETLVFSGASSINVPPNKRSVGMVFQSYAIWPHKTVSQNVAFPLKMQRRPAAEIRERTAEALDLVGLGAFATRSASRLSGGQMQRVALARSLVARPNVLLLDEPLSNLDAQLRESLRFEIRQLQQTIGVTSVYVTHDQSEALALADRIAVMRDGEIIQLDKPENVFKHPANRFVAEFLGVANMFDGRVVRAEGRNATVELVGGGGVLKGRSNQQLTAGDAVLIGARAETLTVHAPDYSAADDESTIPGRVEVVNYLGTEIRYRVRIGETVATCVSVDTGERFEAGQEVSLAIAANDCIVLAE